MPFPRMQLERRLAQPLPGSLKTCRRALEALVAGVRRVHFDEFVSHRQNVLQRPVVKRSRDAALLDVRRGHRLGEQLLA